MSNFDDYDPIYDGVWNRRESHKALDSDSHLDDIEVTEGQLYGSCSRDLKDAVNGLLIELRSGNLRVFSNQDIISLTKMHKRSWSQFVDPRLSHPSSSTRSARIVLWECSEHHATLFSVKGRWDVSYLARLVEDFSILSDDELISGNELDAEEKTEIFVGDLVDDDDLVSEFESEEDRERRELLDKDLERLILLGFEKQDILETFKSKEERLLFIAQLTAVAKQQNINMSELADGLLSFDLFVIRKILDIGHFLGEGLNEYWLNHALGKNGVTANSLFEIENEIFRLLGYFEDQCPAVFMSPTQRSIYFNKVIAQFIAIEISTGSHGQVTFVDCLRILGDIDLLCFRLWCEIGISFTPVESADWFLLGRRHPLISDLTNKGIDFPTAIQELHNKFRSL